SSFALPVLQVGSPSPEGPPPMSNAPTATAPPEFAPLHLTDQQRDDLLAAVTAMLRDATAGRPAACPPLPWADRPVGGAYVSLKRGGHLRSPCGPLTPSVSLRPALEDAAAPPARKDLRMPPQPPPPI